MLQLNKITFILLQHLFYFIAHKTTLYRGVKDQTFISYTMSDRDHDINTVSHKKDQLYYYS